MRYMYYFHPADDDEQILSAIETTEPLPHLSVGNELLLTTDQHSPLLGQAPKIQNIRTVISHLSGGFKRYDVHVYCQATSN